jgi:hypothetical protein
LATNRVITEGELVSKPLGGCLKNPDGLRRYLRAYAIACKDDNFGFQPLFLFSEVC